MKQGVKNTKYPRPTATKKCLAGKKGQDEPGKNGTR